MIMSNALPELQCKAFGVVTTLSRSRRTHESAHLAWALRRQHRHGRIVAWDRLSKLDRWRCVTCTSD